MHERCQREGEEIHQPTPNPIEDPNRYDPLAKEVSWRFLGSRDSFALPERLQRPHVPFILGASSLALR